jgi:hypothetical protein
VTDDISKQQEEINRKIDEAYSRLDTLKGDDVGVSDELKELNTLRDRFTVLSEINDRLAKLENIGGGDLFWGADYNPETVQREHHRIHNLVTNYDSRVAELQSLQKDSEETVESLTAKINVLNEDTVALLELEEELLEEFIVEREMVEQPFREMAMPWNNDGKDQKNFRKILLIVLLFSMLLGILIPLWDIPIPDRVEVVKVPERLAKLIVPKKQAPPPPPKQEKLDEKKPEKEKVKKDKKPVPEKAKKSRKKAEKAGLMAFKDDFADLIDDKADAKLGASAKVSGKGRAVLIQHH